MVAFLRTYEALLVGCAVRHGAQSRCSAASGRIGAVGSACDCMECRCGHSQNHGERMTRQASHGMARLSRPWPSRARQAWQVVDWRCPVCPGRQGKATTSEARSGSVRRGLAGSVGPGWRGRPYMVGLAGTARLVNATTGLARQARLRTDWRCREWPGRHGLSRFGSERNVAAGKVLQGPFGQGSARCGRHGFSGKSRTFRG